MTTLGWLWDLAVRTVRDRLDPIVAGVLVALLVLGGLLGAIGLQPPVQEATVVLLARAGANGGDLPDRITMAYPSIVESARSPALLRAVLDRTGASGDPDELARRVRVQILPEEGTVVLSVRGPSAGDVTAVTAGIAREVIAQDLLAPAGTIVATVPASGTVQVAPRPLLGGALALLAAVAAGATTGVVSARARGLVRTEGDVHAVLGRRDLAVVDLAAPTTGEDPLARIGQSLTPGTVVRLQAVGAVDPDVISGLTDRLAPSGAVGTPDVGGSTGTRVRTPTVTFLLVPRRTPSELVRDTLLLARQSRPDLAGVIVL